MNFGIREKIFKQICEVVEKYKYRFVIFGSRARGDYRPNSDIDIAILDDVPNEEKYRIRDDFDKIDMEYMMDIVFINEISKKELIENILKEGIDVKWKDLKKEWVILKMH